MMNLVDRIRNIDFDTTDNNNVSDENLLRVILQLDIYLNAHYLCLPDNILDTISQNVLHIRLQSLSIIQRVNISVRYLEALTEIFLLRSYCPYILLLQDALTYIEDLSDMCM
jgi:hypothetical protein